jgi:hypothetical protein
MRSFLAAAILLAVAGTAHAEADQKIDRMSVDTMDTFKPGRACLAGRADPAERR